MTNGIDRARIVTPEEVSVGGCRCVAQRVHKDERGVLVVDMQERSTQDVLQVYHSITYADKARDKDAWHLHQEQLDRFFVVWGNVAFALSDGEQVQIVHINADEPYALTIPPGVYHCLYSSSAVLSIILNVPDMLYNPDDELRIPFTELRVPHPW